MPKLIRLWCLFYALPVLAIAGPNPIDNPWFTLRLGRPTPTALVAFYEGRECPKAMIEAIRNTCYLNRSLRNKSDTIVWLDLAQWRFTTSRGISPLLTRALEAVLANPTD
ncbi:MAG: hypothetical protein HY080_04445 [Gammaproteobacteria bacterium]|nr:hypothetical protein [Gammaproteobacteria bacterium]